MKQTLTARQQEALDFISACLNDRGFPPTLREIGEHMGIRSTNGVNDHLKALERKGYLVREELKSRALKPVGFGPHGREARGAQPAGRASLGPTDDRVGPHAQSANAGGFGSMIDPLASAEGEGVDVPILGRVAAGEPILAEQNVVDRVKVDRFFLGAVAQPEVFGLVIQGESMIEDGIHDGDYIFVRKQPTAGQGEIVVVMIDGEATCKRFYLEGDTIRLQPANHAMKPIFVRESDFRQVGILGKVVGVYRRL